MPAVYTTPEWKRELIERQKRKKLSLIRLPSVIIDRERKISLPSPSPSATTGDFSPSEALGITRNKPIVISGDSVNGFSNDKQGMLNGHMSNRSSGLPLPPYNGDDIWRHSVGTMGRKPSQLSWTQVVKNNETLEVEILENKTEEMVEIESENLNLKNREYDLGYGSTPGIVNRLRAKFASLSLHRESPPEVTPSSSVAVPPLSPAINVPIPPPLPLKVRRAASLEDLLDVDEISEEHSDGFVARLKDRFKQNVNIVKDSTIFMNRARSMEVLAPAEQRKSNLKNAILPSKNIIIIEQSKPSGTEVKNSQKPAVKKPNTFTKPSSGHLEKVRKEPKTVRECVEMFQQSKGFIPYVSPPKYASTLPTSPLPVIEINREVEVITLDEPVVPKEPPKATEPKSSFNSIRDVYLRNIPLSPSYKPPVPNNNYQFKKPEIEIQRPVAPILPYHSESIDDTPKLKLTVEKVDQSLLKAARNPSGNSSLGSNTFFIKPMDKKDKTYLPGVEDYDFVIEQKPTKTIPAKINDDLSVPIILSDITTPIDKPDSAKNDVIKPHPSLQRVSNDNPVGAPLVRQDSVPPVSYTSTIKTPIRKATEVIGANIIVGRSSMLKTRNKKFQLLFDDKALRTYEYPSEWTLLNDNDEDSMSNTPAEPIPDYDTADEIDIYKKLVSSDVQISLNTDQELSFILKPVTADKNELWSRSQTSDLLF